MKQFERIFFAKYYFSFIFSDARAGLQRYNTQHNDTQHNDTQHNDTHRNDIQHKDTQRKRLILDTRHTRHSAYTHSA
jgi:hypothetical protein